jgi:hypothetical protein
VNVFGALSEAFARALNGMQGAGLDSRSAALQVIELAEQSCGVDTDCVAVDQLPGCPASACDGCLSAAVNKSVWSRYQTALHQAFATDPPVGLCNCPGLLATCCRQGTCQADGCFSPADNLPACADAGGTCLLSVFGCSEAGPTGACAYSEESCCLN